MNAPEVLQQLEEMGTAQNRKVYRRHGVGGNQYGVSYANLNTLKKKIKKDQELAQSLWASGNHDARILATMVADPAHISDQTLEAWSKDLDCYPLADAFSGLVNQTPAVRQKMERWTTSDDEWIGQTGWNLLAYLAMNDKELRNDYFSTYLTTIEKDIHQSKNRVRYAMNNALIAIGLRNEKLQAEAIAAADRIGPVIVDHGETNCKTPDAVPYIRKAAARKKSKT